MEKAKGKKAGPKKTTSRKTKPVPVKEKDYEQDFEYICMEIERGAAVRNAVKAFMSNQKFYDLVDENKELAKRYARACEARAESIFEDILDIADTTNADLSINEKMQISIDGEAIQRSKLKIDARKWMLSKMDPKKYGDRQQLEHSGEINSNKPDLSKLSVEELRTWGALIRKSSK